MESPKQHVQVPHDEFKSLPEMGLQFIDPYIYACIKRHMNAHTLLCCPSITVIVRESGFKRNTVIAALDRLETAGYILKKTMVGASTKYFFNEYEKFDIFSYEMLDHPKLTPKEKAYLIATQRYMIKHEGDHTGIISFTQKQLAELIGISRVSLIKYEKALSEKGVMKFLPSQKVDNETGLKVQDRIYDFKEFANMLAFTFEKVDTRLDQHEIELKDLKKQIQMLTEDNKRLNKEMEKLKAQDAKIIL